MKQQQRYNLLMAQAAELRERDEWPSEEAWEAFQTAEDELMRLEMARTLGNDNYTAWNRDRLNAAENALGEASRC